MVPPSNPTIRVGVNRDFLPFTAADGEHFSGLLIDSVRATFAALEVTPQFVARPLMNLPRQFEGGEIDVLAGVALTARRNSLARFSVPLARSGGGWFVATAADTRDPATFRRVATPGGGPLAPYVREHCRQGTVFETQNYDDAIQSVLDNAVDAAALNYHVGNFRVANAYAGQLERSPGMFCNLDIGLAFAPSVPLQMIDGFNTQVSECGTDISESTLDSYSITAPRT